MLDVKNVSKTFAKGTVNEHIALEKINLHLDRANFSPLSAPTAPANPPCLT